MLLIFNAKLSHDLATQNSTNICSSYHASHHSNTNGSYSDQTELLFGGVYDTI